MVAGCQVTVKDGGYLVLIALRDGGKIVDVATLGAPRAECESDALAGLTTRVCDLLRDREVTRLGLWHYEGTPRGVSVNAARPVLRAEGVVVAVAGTVGAEVVEISAMSERKKAGLSTNEALVEQRVALLSGTWSKTARRAVAAATYL